jgi:hypothetical protein
MTFLLANWRLIGMALMLLGVGGYITHCQYTKRVWAEAQAIAQRQGAENAKQAHRDLLNKERSDENYQRNLARLRADVKRLRNARPSFVPPAVPGATDPDRACFSRPELDAALRSYRDGIIELLGEGAAAVDGLDEAKSWVQGR